MQLLASFIARLSVVAIPTLALAACTTGPLSLGEDSLSKPDASSPDANGADGGECRPVPPIVPSACPNGRIKDRRDANGCWLGFDCEPLDQDAGEPDAGPPCPAQRGACVGISPTSCVDGVFAPASVASCGAGVGVGCCISCPQIVQAICPPDRQRMRSEKDVYGCTVGYQCFASFPLGDADSGKTVAAKTHDEIVLTLTTNASTGYLWSITKSGGLSAPIESHTSGPAPGDDGTHVFQWADLPTGNFAVTLEYKRPFETTPARTFTFTANVAP